MKRRLGLGFGALLWACVSLSGGFSPLREGAEAASVRDMSYSVSESNSELYYTFADLGGSYVQEYRFEPGGAMLSSLRAAEVPAEELLLAIADFMSVYERELRYPSSDTSLEYELEESAITFSIFFPTVSAYYRYYYNADYIGGGGEELAPSRHGFLSDDYALEISDKYYAYDADDSAGDSDTGFLVMLDCLIRGFYAERQDGSIELAFDGLYARYPVLFCALSDSLKDEGLDILDIADELTKHIDLYEQRAFLTRFVGSNANEVTNEAGLYYHTWAVSYREAGLTPNREFKLTITEINVIACYFTGILTALIFVGAMLTFIVILPRIRAGRTEE